MTSTALGEHVTSESAVACLQSHSDHVVCRVGGGGGGGVGGGHSFCRLTVPLKTSLLSPLH